MGTPRDIVHGWLQGSRSISPGHAIHALFWLRWIAVCGQAAVILVAAPLMGITLPVALLSAAPAALVLWNLFEWRRLRRAHRVTAAGAWLSLLVDMAALTWLLYWTGGHANPFVSLYLVPLAVACLMLPAVWTLTTLAIALAAYSTLVVFHQPLPHWQGAGAFDLHLTGMWANFVLSAVLIVAFGSFLVHSLRAREQALAESRSRRRRDQEVLGLGAAVVGAVHDLATPLSTASTLADCLREGEALPPQAREDVEALRRELARCRQRIQGLLRQARSDAEDGLRRCPLSAFLGELTTEWRRSHPEIRFTQAGDAFEDARPIVAGGGLVSALNGLFANAARAASSASDPALACTARIVDGRLVLEIADNGPGIDRALHEQLGVGAVQSSSGGFGIGLVLADAALESLGGEVVLEPRPQRGTNTRVVLPLERIGAAPVAPTAEGFA